MHKIHGGLVKTHIFSYAVANWTLIETDDRYCGFIQSLESIAFDPPLSSDMANFLRNLLVYPQKPVIWLNQVVRQNAPLFVASNIGPQRKPHAKYVQFGCKKCNHQTEMLYFASKDSKDRDYAHAVMQAFFEPLIHEELNRLGSVGNLAPRFCFQIKPRGKDDDSANRPATQHCQLADRRATPCRRLAVSPRPSFRPAPPPPPPVWSKYPDNTGYTYWLHALTYEWFFELTGSKQPPEQRFGGCYQAAKDRNRPAPPTPPPVWSKYRDNNGSTFWLNALTHEWFFELTGSTQPPEQRFGGCCQGAKDNTSSEIGTDSGSTSTGETESLVDACMESAGSQTSCGPCSRMSGSPNPSSSWELCTHRCYAHNLYAVLEVQRDDAV